MKLHSMIIVGGAGLLLLGACSPSSYQTTFPEPAYVKVSTNNGAYAPYPDNPIGQQELVYWYDSLTTPMTVVAEVPGQNGNQEEGQGWQLGHQRAPHHSR